MSSDAWHSRGGAVNDPVNIIGLILLGLTWLALRRMDGGRPRSRPGR